MSENARGGKVYALNLFDLEDDEKYLSYFSRLPVEIPAHGGRPIALGRFRANVTGDLTPRQILILVEWESQAAFDSFRDDPALADLHPLRVHGSSSYIWQLFDGLDLTDPGLTLDEVLGMLQR
ncbi:DUF1330 domain-containing protein [Nocardioides immobilis]|uniref:DUF1330 domain-containing protein n=1 Tax=Nocardioides immobilis TaxID=2049295 RepID=A0A417Y129_9ACTN|nr:DUF1330 domain-containing protein [Nocardioides immobilis]RHW26305.1 DUF1330 domain-containing protein [Nocardioides immobilis]